MGPRENSLLDFVVLDRHALRRSAGFRYHLHQSAAAGIKKDDDSLRRPGTTSGSQRHVADDGWRPAGNRYSFEFATRKEGNRLTCRREEGISRAVGAGQRFRLERIEVANVKLIMSLAAGNICEPSSVGRQRQRARGWLRIEFLVDTQIQRR